MEARASIDFRRGIRGDQSLWSLGRIPVSFFLYGVLCSKSKDTYKKGVFFSNQQVLLMDLTSSQLGFPILQIPRIFLAKGEGVPSFASLNPGLKMYFLSKMGIFQPAMLVYQTVISNDENIATLKPLHFSPSWTSWGLNWWFSKLPPWFHRNGTGNWECLKYSVKIDVSIFFSF